MKKQLLFLSLLFITSCAPRYKHLSDKEIQDNLRKKELARKENILKREKANDKLKFVEAIDTVLISVIEGELKDMSEVFETYPELIKNKLEINFVKDNFIKLDTTSQKEIMKYLFQKKMKVHFLDSSEVNMGYYKGMGFYYFQADLDNEENFTGVYINVYVIPLASRGYYCELEKVGNKYKVVRWYLSWIS